MILLLVTFAAQGTRPTGAPWPGRVLGDFGFSVILPLTALVIGSSVLGAEIDEGSIIHLLATPVRRSAVIVTKFVVGTLLTMLFVAVPELIAGLIATSGDQLRAASSTPPSAAGSSRSAAATTSRSGCSPGRWPARCSITRCSS